MHYIAPIVVLLGLSGALYKTKEVWNLPEYKVMVDNPTFALRISGVQDRTKYLAALAAKQKAAAGASGY